MTQTEQRKKYGAPTWTVYGDNGEQWREWKRQAAELETSELRRHASVPTSNRHECQNCFCCAALETLREREG